jgi:hypothetical protein
MAAGVGGGFHGDSEGQEVGPNGTWYTYRIESDGDTWYAYVNGIVEGSYDLGASNSAGSMPYAVAEVEGTYVTNIPLGPVEFRDLEYRDMNSVWHNVSDADAWMGYGVGSGTLPTGTHFPYGLEVIGVNDWIAGTGLSTTLNNTSVWSQSSAVPALSSASVPTSTPFLATNSIVLGNAKDEEACTLALGAYRLEHLLTTRLIPKTTYRPSLQLFGANS